MGVVSDGELYGFPVGVACSVPVRSEGGEWEVVRDVHISPAIQVRNKNGHTKFYFFRCRSSWIDRETLYLRN